MAYLEKKSRHSRITCRADSGTLTGATGRWHDLFSVTDGDAKNSAEDEWDKVRDDVRIRVLYVPRFTLPCLTSTTLVRVVKSSTG